MLKPLSWIWAATTARRIARGRSVDPGAPVISVGNLTVGGSGKTPVARELLRLLRRAGVDAHGLSRGHGGSLKGPVRVDPARHSAGEVGDEPLLLASEAPVWIARDRSAGALAAVHAGAQAVVMDDGHQNPSLKKALALVVVDGETRNDEWPFGDGAVFPSGPMREPLKRGLARADAVVVLLADDAPPLDPELRAMFGDLPVFTARLEPSGPPPPGPRLGFAGIAKPWKVERALVAAGCELIDFAPFPDHARFTERDLNWLAEQAEARDARLVTTEKDWVRLPQQWRERIAAWPVVTRFEDEAAVTALVLGVVSSCLDP